MCHRTTMPAQVVACAPVAPVGFALARSSFGSLAVTDTPNLPARPARVGRVRRPGGAGATGRPAARGRTGSVSGHGAASTRILMRRWIVLSLALALALVARPALAVDDCATVNMTVTAQVSTDPGFEGLYKYTVTGNWDIGQYGLSHIDFFLALKNLECVCDPRVARFPALAGTSTGTNAAGACVVSYTGKYNCKGDPSIPAELRAPTIKFDAVDGTCETGTTGTGSWTFYSPFPPAPYSVEPDAVAIKHGQQVCLGDLAGRMPMGDCSTPARAASWGGVKATYR